MKLFQATLLLTAPIFKGAKAQNGFYPDWQGGSGTCLSDGNESVDITNNNYFEATAELCCDRFYRWDYCNCVEGSGGTTCTGTSQWIVDYANNGCVKDCPTDSGDPLCGGLATSADQLFSSETLCCQGKLAYVALGLCEANSLGTTPYVGSNKFYVDYQTTSCVADCDAATAGCGGIVTTSSTTLYDTTALCCSSGFSTMDQDLCQCLSDPTCTGTQKAFADGQDSMCVIDSDAADCPDPGNTCERADATSGTLYADIADCCTGLSYIPEAYCIAMSTGTPSDKWFVSYEDGVCKQDCASGVSCATMDHVPNAMYDTAAACCAAKLSSLDSTTCEQMSSNGTAFAGTGSWYAASTGVCAQDCEGGAPCGGIAGAWDTKYSSAAACCTAKFSWMEADLCQALSAGAYTSKFYIDWTTGVCAQDCIGAAPCSDHPDDLSTQLFADATACCKAKLGWMNTDRCVALSTGAAASGSGDWYSSSSSASCVQDCAGAAPCGGVMEGSDSLYADATACCSAEFGWVDSTLCAAISEGTYTSKFYVDWQTGKCTQDCPTGSASCGDHPSDLSVTLHATAEACCAAHFGYMHSATCVAITNGDAATGTSKWYSASDGSNKCVQDCDGAEPCGGIMTTQERLYENANSCCAAKYSWIDTDLCVGLSTGLHTDKFYIDWQSSSCVKDCDVSGGGACAGFPSDLSVDLYASAESCCQAKFSNPNSCIALATGATTSSTEYYVSWKYNKCVMNCDGAAPCGGLANSWDTLYSTSASCCKRLSWVSASSCVLA